ncbi:MAG: family 20 glycosylhydrolase [Chitinophagaceae bacterium]|nr:family 20 glycosylhydrolase [Chitinophagaceae bacterium]
MVVRARIRAFLPLLFLLFSVRVDVFADDLPGSGLLPVPRKMSLSDDRNLFDNSWRILHSTGVSIDDAAVSGLINDVNDRFGFVIKAGPATSHIIRLRVKEGAVKIGDATDTNRGELMKQAYRLEMNGNSVNITANASAGLYYGVQTFLQLLSTENGKVMFPSGTIEDWPDLELRVIYWDDAHHLEKIKALKRAIRQAAHYKINGFALKLEGHFQYKIAKPIVEPYAYTPEEYQDLTNYALKHHVQLIPFLDYPAHVSFILKHPEFASLRAYPNNNYEFSVVNPKAEELIIGMFNELFEANKGVKYVFLSTDEAYYVGKADNEKEAAKSAGGNGALLAKIIAKVANELHKKGRSSIIWGEYPLTEKDVPALPSHIIDGVYDSQVASLYRKQGIRQMIYTSTQGVEPLFPEYYNYPANKFEAIDTAKSRVLTDDEMQQGELGRGRVEGLLRTISSAIAEKKSDFMGTIVAGWGDSGLNPETFWLGYTTGSAAGWNHKEMTSPDLSDRFFRSFYGSGSENIKKIYQLMSSQSQFWDDSWEWAPLQLRTPIVGNSEGIFDEPRHLKDQTLLPLPSLNSDLSPGNDWNALNAQRLRAVEKYLKENTQLINLLQETLQKTQRQHFNLRVFISIANLCRQNLRMLLHLQQINSLLALPSSSTDPAISVSLFDHALDKAIEMREERNEMLRSLETVWYEEWFPRVSEANGRVFLDKVDDVKDHVPVRTVDMTYLIYRQLNYPMDKWWDEVLNARNKLAAEKNLPLRNSKLDWKNVD